MGVHTGDSVTVAPQMTLSDEAYQELRDAAAAVIRAVGVETGGSNIQFARDRETRRAARDRDEPARLALVGARVEGDRLPDREGRREARRRLHARRDPERPHRTTPASFEPTLDYVVVKFPRFAFEKFPGADTTLGTQMKSVGEAMGIGRTFTRGVPEGDALARARPGAETPWATLDDVPDGVHPWFLAELDRSRSALADVRSLDELVADDWLRLKRLGISDADVAAACGVAEESARAQRRACGVGPSTAASTRAPARSRPARTTSTPTWGEADEAPPRAGPLASSSSAPARTGSARASSSTTAASTRRAPSASWATRR